MLSQCGPALSAGDGAVAGDDGSGGHGFPDEQACSARVAECAIRAAREAAARHAELLAGAVKLGDVRLEAQWRRQLRESLMRYDGLRARLGLPAGTPNGAPGAEDAEREQQIADIAAAGERRRELVRDRLAEAG